MVQKDFKFPDGTRIYYEVENGLTKRIIEYSYTPNQKKKIDKNPTYKQIYDRQVRKYNAGKFYYLEVLHGIAFGLNESQKEQLYNDIKILHDRIGDDDDSIIVNKEFFSTFGKYWPENQVQCAAFFVTIYLAMLDLEEGKKQYAHSLGKTMVLKSCEAVILKNMDPSSAATMFGRRHGISSNDEQEYYEYSESEYDSPYEKYNGYNDYDDDTIDTAFDGHPEATWNVD